MGKIMNCSRYEVHSVRGSIGVPQQVFFTFKHTRKLLIYSSCILAHVADLVLISLYLWNWDVCSAEQGLCTIEHLWLDVSDMWIITTKWTFYTEATVALLVWRGKIIPYVISPNFLKREGGSFKSSYKKNYLWWTKTGLKGASQHVGKQTLSSSCFPCWAPT